MLPLLLLVAATHAPLALHPENPRYFLFRGKPTVLVTSGEHYGAVLNLDFDYVRYLDELAADGLNHTRTFSGTYREVPCVLRHHRQHARPEARPLRGALGPEHGARRLRRGDEVRPLALGRGLLPPPEGLHGRGAERGVVVEMNLFCPFYEESLWDANPMNARNNVNGVGKVPRDEVYTLKHADLTAIQEAVVRKIVTELNAFDNLYFEVCNEPYFGGITLEWQHHVAAIVAETEAKLPRRHLVSMNIANGTAKIETPNPARLHLQLPLRDPARRGGGERPPARRDRRRTRRASAGETTSSTAPRAGTSCSPAAASTTTSTTRSRRRTRTGRSSTTPPRAAGTRRSGGSCGSSRTSSTRSTSSG